MINVSEFKRQSIKKAIELIEKHSLANNPSVISRYADWYASEAKAVCPELSLVDMSEISDAIFQHSTNKVLDTVI